MSLIKNRLSGRVRQLPSDLRDCFMFSNTMAVTTFALSAPLEDGAYSEEENIFKIDVSLLACPSSSWNFKALFWKSKDGCFPSPAEPSQRGQVGNLPSAINPWDSL